MVPRASNIFCSTDLIYTFYELKLDNIGPVEAYQDWSGHAHLKDGDGGGVWANTYFDPW